MTSIEVSDGPNYKTNRGNVVLVSNVIFHPTLDLAILEFATPFQFSENKTIGTANVGDITLSAGYGSWGTGSSSSLVWTGDRRAWEARVDDVVIGYSAPLYQSTIFDTGTGLSLNARAANGDSGGPVFNLNGELVGLNTSASTFIANFGHTTYLALGEPTTKAWILANTQVPEEPGLPPNIDTDNNGFTQLQEHYLNEIPKDFHIGDNVNIDLSEILALNPLSAGQSISISGLPKGLKFDPATGLITGTVKGFLGKAPVRIVLKQGKNIIGFMPFDWQVLQYKFKGGYQALLKNIDNMPDGIVNLKVSSSVETGSGCNFLTK